MTLGTNNKKQVIILAALGLVAVYLVYTNVIAGPDLPKTTQRTASPAAAPIVPGAPAGPGQTGPPAAKRAGSRVRTQEFHPVYLNRNPTKRPDPRTIDPTLQLERFAKVQSVDLAGGARNVFAFSAAPPPVQTAAVKPAGPEPTVWVNVGPRQPPPPPPPQPPPPPPPITLKFYGFSTSTASGKRTAYLLDGEEIYIAAEGDTLKRRYKIIRIGPTSILIEDLDAKRQQSVPLMEESAG
jgi:hypothetical protein